MNDIMRNRLDWLVAQARSSSTWRGLIDVGTGVGLFKLVGMTFFPQLPPEAHTAILGLAGALVTRGAVGIFAKDETKAASVKKVEDALQVIADKHSVTAEKLVEDHTTVPPA